jgi:hypothetical protein
MTTKAMAGRGTYAERGATTLGPRGYSGFVSCCDSKTQHPDTPHLKSADDATTDQWRDTPSNVT